MKMPTRPKEMSPPTTPANTRRSDRLAPPLRMRSGRRMLSIGMTITIQTRRKVPQPEAPLQ
jgi:hypothetical protein